ncbi:hypothetical protein NVP1031O_191 [Vibrio phage 1.031.O._10N.261.46.F8]|nr:hypothetical protein NVP1031O_191 [Vibrio phage 1.031.O._10N.261.46.F8]
MSKNEESTSPSNIDEAMEIDKNGNVTVSYVDPIVPNVTMGHIPSYNFGVNYGSESDALSAGATNVDPTPPYRAPDHSSGPTYSNYDSFFNSKDYQTGFDPLEEQILRQVTHISQDRVTYFKVLNEFEGHYLVNAIYDVLFDEILRDSGTGVEFEVSASNDKYKQTALECIERFNLPGLVENMLTQLLHYGDYTYNVDKYTDKENDGENYGKIKDITDDYIPGEVVALLHGQVPVGYYRLPQVRRLREGAVAGREVRDIMTEVTEVDFDSVMHFTLQGKKLKVELDKSAREVIHAPQLYLGRSFVWSVIDKLQILKFREVAEAARDLSNLTRPTLVGVQIPQTETGKKAVSFCQKFEKLLNSGVQDPAEAMNGSDGLVGSLSKVMSGRYKAIPQYSSGRGSANKLDLEDQIRSNDRTDEKLQKERELICNLLGVPPELVLNLLSGTERQSVQRMYTRLAKKSKSVQRSIVRTLTQFIVHYVATELGDEDVSESDFTLNLRSATSVEDIDDAESLGYVIDNVRNLVGIADEIKRAGLAGYVEGTGPTPDDPMAEREGKSPIEADKFMDYLRTELSRAGSTAANIWIGGNEEDVATTESITETNPDEPEEPTATGE